MKKLLILSIAMLIATAASLVPRTAYAALTPTQYYNVSLQDAITNQMWQIKLLAKQIDYAKAQVDARIQTLKTNGVNVTPIPWGTTTLDLQNIALPNWALSGFGT